VRSRESRKLRNSLISQEAHDAQVAANREVDDEAVVSLAASSPGSGRGFRDAADAESPQGASVGGRHFFADSPRGTLAAIIHLSVRAEGPLVLTVGCADIRARRPALFALLVL
jgi:hypothetical protein